MTLADVLAALAGLGIAGAGCASISAILSLFLPNAVERAGARIGIGTSISGGETG